MAHTVLYVHVLYCEGRGVTVFNNVKTLHENMFLCIRFANLYTFTDAFTK